MSGEHDFQVAVDDSLLGSPPRERGTHSYLLGCDAQGILSAFTSFWLLRYRTAAACSRCSSRACSRAEAWSRVLGASLE